MAEPESTDNITLAKGDRSYQSNNTYTCIAGHYLNADRDTEITSICDGQEQWTFDTTPQCARKY